MCWSESADLAAGSAVMAVALLGVASVRSWRMLPAALLPVLLASHQLIEGHIWGSLVHGRTTGAAVTAWAVIAYCALPVVVPLAVMAVGPRRRRLVPFLVAGCVAAGCFGHYLAVHGATAIQRGHVLDYGVVVAKVGVASITYQAGAVWSCFASPRRDVKILGLGLGGTGILAGIIDQVCLASIWCAFAAVTSLLVVWVVRNDAKAQRPSGSGPSVRVAELATA